MYENCFHRITEQNVLLSLFKRKMEIFLKK